MHLHTPAGVAVACQKDGLLPISQQSLFVLASLAYHGYEGVALNDAEKPRLVNDLGDNTFLILPNHGLLTVGGSIADAFLAMYTMQRACEIQVLAQSGGGELIPIPKPILDGAAAQRAQVTRGLGGALAWPGAAAQAGSEGCGVSDVVRCNAGAAHERRRRMLLRPSSL